MIDSAAFIQRLNRFKPLSLKLSSSLTDGIRVNRFEAQETFLSPGNYAAAIYFIQSGIVRGAIEGEAERMTTWFKQEGDLVIPQNVFNQQASEEYISAIAKTTVLAIPIKHVQKIMETSSEMMELVISLILESHTEGRYREKLLRIPAAKDRYSFLATHENFILKRVPHYLIASYLNVTKETFSRLHKGLAY